MSRSSYNAYRLLLVVAAVIFIAAIYTIVGAVVA